MTKYRIIERLNYNNDLRYYIQRKSLWFWHNLNLSGYIVDPGYLSISMAEYELNKYLNRGPRVVKEIDVDE